MIVKLRKNLIITFCCILAISVFTSVIPLFTAKKAQAETVTVDFSTVTGTGSPAGDNFLLVAGDGNTYATSGVSSSSSAAWGLVPGTCTTDGTDLFVNIDGNPTATVNGVNVYYGYVIYKIEATSGYVLDTMTLDLNAYLNNISADDNHAGNRISVCVGSAGNIDSLLDDHAVDYTMNETGTQVPSLDAFQDFPTANLTNKVKEKSTVYVAVVLYSTARNFTTDWIGWARARLNTLTFNYTMVEGEGGGGGGSSDDIYDRADVVSNLFTVNGSGAYSFIVGGEAAYIYGGNGAGCGANAEHGAIPGTWSNSVTISADAYIIYKFDSSDGIKQISNMKIQLYALLRNFGDGIMHDKNRITVSVGTTADNFTMVREFSMYNSDVGNADSFRYLPTVSVSSDLTGNSTVYVKISLAHATTCEDGHKSEYMPDGNFDMAHIGTKLGKVFVIYDEMESDAPKTPKPDDYTIAEEIPVGYEYSFTLRMYDYTSGTKTQVNYSVIVTTPYATVDYSTDSAWDTVSFTPQFTGTYSIEITASNSNGTYDNTVSLEVIVPAGMSSISLNNEASPNGRTGKEYEITSASTKGATPDQTIIKVFKVSDNSTVAEFTDFNDGHAFIPSDIGEYRVMYRVKNVVDGVERYNHVLVRVYVKYDYGDDKRNVYNYSNNASYWEGGTSQGADGVYINGTAYSYLPFSIGKTDEEEEVSTDKIENGLTVQLTLDFGNDGYRYFRISRETTGGMGLYFRFYAQSQNFRAGDSIRTYYVHVNYGTDYESGAPVIASTSVGAATKGGNAVTVSITLEKVFGGDGIKLYINGEQNTNYDVVTLVKAIRLSDNEYFSYVGGRASGSELLVHTRVGDTTAPTVDLGETKIPDAAKSGESFAIPEIIIKDNIDGDGVIKPEIFFYSPNGDVLYHLLDGEVKKDVSGEGKFQFNKKEDGGYGAGIYKMSVLAQDSAGNKTFKVYEINVDGYSEQTTPRREIAEDFSFPDSDADYAAGVFSYDVLLVILVIGSAVAAAVAIVFTAKFISLKKAKRNKK